MGSAAKSFLATATTLARRSLSFSTVASFVRCIRRIFDELPRYVCEIPTVSRCIAGAVSVVTYIYENVDIGNSLTLLPPDDP